MKSILETLSGDLAKKRSSKNIIYTSLGLLASVGFIVAAALFILDKTSTVYLLLMTIGVVGVITFSVKLCLGCRELIYLPTKSRVKDFSIYIETDEMHRLMYALETADTSLMTQIRSPKESGLRLDVVLSSDNKFAACQIFKYVPYNYEAVSTVYRIADNHLSQFCKGMGELSIAKS